MRSVVVILFTILSFYYNTVTGQSKRTTKYPGTPFQGTKEFCSFSKPVKYNVTITGNKVTIIYLYKEDKNTIKGEFRKGRLYTNDKSENKLNAGKVYRLSDTYISVNNLEGGDFVEYNLCK